MPVDPDDRPNDEVERFHDLADVLQIVRENFRSIETVPDLYEASVQSLSEALSVDRSVLAGERDGVWTVLESTPPGWRPTNGPADLLSPVSLPCLSAKQGTSCLIDDWADTRSAAPASTGGPDPTQIRFVLSVPFGEEDLLVACSRSPGAFWETDRDIAETIGGYASTLLATIEPGADRHGSEFDLNQAATALAHDAKNYLTIIKGRCELARTDPDPEYFEAIDRAAERLSDLVDDTATLLHAGEPVTETEWFDLADAVRLSWDVAGTPTADLELESLGRINADWSRVTRLLENLFRNATEHGGPEVTVEVGSLPAGDGFYVEDDGPGLPPRDAEAVGSGAGWSATDSREGFGLNIVEWIAEAHGWELTVAAADSGGVRFEFRGVAR